MVLVTNGRLITRDSEGKGYYEHGAVAYEGAKIVEVGEEAALRQNMPMPRSLTPRAASSCLPSSTHTPTSTPHWPAA